MYQFDSTNKGTFSDFLEAFTGHQVYGKTVFLTWNLAHIAISTRLAFIKKIEKFWTKSLRDTKFSKNTCCLQYLRTRAYILTVQYLEETLFQTSEFFHGSYSSWVLYMRKVSGQHSKKRFFRKPKILYIVPNFIYLIVTKIIIQYIHSEISSNITSHRLQLTRTKRHLPRNGRLRAVRARLISNAICCSWLLRFSLSIHI
jgi:hypothetical protein